LGDVDAAAILAGRELPVKGCLRQVVRCRG